MQKKKQVHDLGIHQWILQFSPNYLQDLLRHLNLSGIAIIHEISTLKEINDVKRQLKKVNNWKHQMNENEPVRKGVFQNILIKERQSLKPAAVKKILMELRPLTEIITIECQTAALTKWAITDRRIDLLTFPPHHVKSLVDASTARLIKEHEKFVELPLSHFLSISPAHRISTLRQYMEALERLRKKDSRIIVTSRAQSPLGLRNPLQVRAFLKSLNFTDDEARKIVIDNPTELLRKNLEKLDPRYLLPGMKLITLEEIIDEMTRKVKTLDEEE